MKIELVSKQVHFFGGKVRRKGEKIFATRKGSALAQSVGSRGRRPKRRRNPSRKPSRNAPTSARTCKPKRWKRLRLLRLLRQRSRRKARNRRPFWMRSSASRTISARSFRRSPRRVPATMPERLHITRPKKSDRMKIFGLTIARRRSRESRRIRLSHTLAVAADGGAFWSRLPGAWQRNIECDPTGTGPSVFRASMPASPGSPMTSPRCRSTLCVRTRTGYGRQSRRHRHSGRYSGSRTATRTESNSSSTWLLSKLITGNAYALKVRDARGIVTELYVLDPRRVTVRYTAAGEIFYSLTSG